MEPEVGIRIHGAMLPLALQVGLSRLLPCTAPALLLGVDEEQRRDVDTQRRRDSRWPW